MAAGVHAFAWYKARPSSGPMIRRYPEAAAQTFVKGDPLKLDTAGRILLAIDTEGNTVPSLNTTGFLGIADADASGTTDALVKVVIITPDDLLAVSASAAGATRTVIRTDVGLKCSWIKSTVSGQTTKSVLDTSDVTSTRLFFEIIDNLDAVGVVNGRYLARVNTFGYGMARPT